MDNAEDHDGAASSNGLFSMSATDNAEVVKPGVQRGADGLWTVSAKPPLVSEEDLDAVDGEVIWEEDGDWDDAAEIPNQDSSDDDPIGSSDHSTDSTPRAGNGFAHESPGSPDDFRQAEAPGSGNLHEDQHDGDIWDVADGEFVGSGRSGADFEDSGDFEDIDDSEFAGDGSTSDGSDSFSAGGNFDSVGSVFSSEPVDRGDDVVDEPDDEEDEFYAGVGDSASSLFSSGSRFGGAGATFASTGAPYFTPAGPPGATSGLWEATDDPSHVEAINLDPLRSEPLWDASDTSYGERGHNGAADLSRHDPQSFGEEDSPGYEAAILKLHPQDRERSSVALSVAGALLKEGEEVLGVVTGQMLGRQAAVVVTAGRVLVVNDRRWQPVVDTYTIDQKLRVRGRHDRNIAALSFTDEWGLSMVDGITEVSIAMDLAEQIRQIAGD